MSVISTSIQTFRADLYNSLIDMENFCSTSATSAPSANFPWFFQKLSDDFVTWMGQPREEYLKPFMPSLYSYIIFNTMYGVDPSILTQVDSRSIFSASGLVETLVASPNTYFDDLTQVTTTWAASGSHVVGDVLVPTVDNGHKYICTVAGDSDSTEPTWPTADGATVVDGTVTWKEYGPPYESSRFTSSYSALASGYDLEKPKVDSLKTSCDNSVQSQSLKMLFEDPDILAQKSKSEMAQEIFNTLHYKEVYSGLNVGSLTLPAGI